MRGVLARAVVVLVAATGFHLAVLAWFPFAIHDWVLAMGIGIASLAAMVMALRRTVGPAPPLRGGVVQVLATAVMLFAIGLIFFQGGLPALVVGVERLASPARYDPAGRARYIQFDRFDIDRDSCRQVFREGSAKSYDFIEVTMACRFSDRRQPPWLVIRSSGQISAAEPGDSAERARVRAGLAAEMERIRRATPPLEATYFEREPGVGHDDLWQTLGDQQLVPRAAEARFLDARTGSLPETARGLRIAAVFAGLFLAALGLAAVLARPRAGRR